MEAKHQHVPRTSNEASLLKATNFKSPSQIYGPRRPINDKKLKHRLLVANDNRVATDTSDKGSENLPSSDSQLEESQFETSTEPELDSQTLKVSNGSTVSSDPKPAIKRLRLTAREKLKAARVLSRNSEPRAYKKAELGSKVLALMRESDRGKKRSGLPEAPTNIFDDSKRGMPKKGLTWELPGGTDVFLIILSVVVISTIMFTTTYIVWKVGAIHFND
ncbi:hypothetical protein LguiA_034820 [Lonicera macranthoides]